MPIAAEALPTFPVQWPSGSLWPTSSVLSMRPVAAPMEATPMPAVAEKPLPPSLADLVPRRYLFSWHLQGGHLCLHPTSCDEVPLPVGGPCRLTLHLHLPVPAEWDHDRRQAALLGTTRPLPEPDAAILGGALLKALSGLVIHETYQVVAFSLTRHYSLRPRLEIIAQPLGE